MITRIRTFFILAMIISAFVGCTEHTQPDPQPEEPEEPEEPIGNSIQPADFLSEEKYNQLIVEIVYIEGYEPTNTSKYHLLSLIDSRLHKSKGLQIFTKSIPSPGEDDFSLETLKIMEEAYRTNETSEQTLAVWIFIADGDYAANKNDSKALGLAYGPTSIALFGKTIKDYSGGLNQPSTEVLESTVLMHEFCHLLGLVNNGTPMVTNHQDAAHGHHCSNQDCLMYYAAETNHFLTHFLWNTPPSLKDQCLQDLKNNGGK